MTIARTGQYHLIHGKISKEEFDGFPQNEKELEERLLSDLLVSFANQLCNNYVDHCAFFTQEKYDSIEI